MTTTGATGPARPPTPDLIRLSRSAKRINRLRLITEIPGNGTFESSFNNWAKTTSLKRRLTIMTASTNTKSRQSVWKPIWLGVSSSESCIDLGNRRSSTRCWESTRPSCVDSIAPKIRAADSGPGSVLVRSRSAFSSQISDTKDSGWRNPEQFPERCSTIADRISFRLRKLRAQNFIVDRRTNKSVGQFKWFRFQWKKL
jgi:hypothetical protein